MAAVGNVAYAAPTAYQGSGLEKSAPISSASRSSASRSSEPVKEASKEATDIAGAIAEKKQAEKKWGENAPDSPPVEIQDEKGANEAIRRAVEEINKKFMSSQAIFGFHDATNRVTIKIVDKSTKEVLKEYPPEQTLDMIAKAWELAGILVDEKR